MFKFRKYEGNPVLKANPENEWENLCTLNPAVVYENGKFHMLYRAAGNDEGHTISLGLADSNKYCCLATCLMSELLYHLVTECSL